MTEIDPDDGFMARELVEKIQKACMSRPYPVSMVAWALQYMLCQVAIIAHVKLKPLLKQMHAIHAEVRSKLASVRSDAGSEKEEKTN